MQVIQQLLKYCYKWLVSLHGYHAKKSIPQKIRPPIMSLCCKYINNFGRNVIVLSRDAPVSFSFSSQFTPYKGYSAIDHLTSFLFRRLFDPYIRWILLYFTKKWSEPLLNILSIVGSTLLAITT